MKKEKKKKEIEFNPADYDYMDNMPMAGWMWEFMRRSPDYRDIYEEHTQMSKDNPDDYFEDWGGFRPIKTSNIIFSSEGIQSVEDVGLLTTIVSPYYSKKSTLIYDQYLYKPIARRTEQIEGTETIVYIYSCIPKPDIKYCDFMEGQTPNIQLQNYSCMTYASLQIGRYIRTSI